MQNNGYSLMNLLSLEWKKWKNNSVVILFGMMYFITSFTVIFIGKEFDNVPTMDQSKVFQFPDIWEWQAYISSWLAFFFLGYLVIYFVTSEVGFKTLRQNIITGMSRMDFFKTKLFTILGLSILATLLHLLFCALVGYFHADPHSFTGIFEDNNWAILRFFLMCLGYCSFALMIGFLIKKPGLAIFAYFTYTLFLEQIGKFGLQSWSFVGSKANYLPMNTLEDLARFPPWKFAEKIPNKVIPEEFFLSHSHAMILSTIYIVIFIGISYWTFSKNDL